MPDEAKTATRFPPMPLEDWAATKETLHRFLQIVGKIRLASAPRRNHWWNVPFHLTGRGITTRPMGVDPIFTIDFDFVDHRLLVTNVTGRTASLPLTHQSVASFYESTLKLLRDLGIEPTIEHPEPFGLTDSTPFADDVIHHEYNPFWVNRYWRILSEVNLILEEFAGRFSGKTSPVHHFWHSMDIAVTRFSDRVVEHDPSVDLVTREAYSRELISFGFWFGDERIPEPAFYAYASPEPDGLTALPLAPEAAEWISQGQSHLAVLRYDDVRAMEDPHASVLEFFERVYRAAASRAGWDIAQSACSDGYTATVPRTGRPSSGSG